MSDNDEVDGAWRYYKHADDLQHRRHQLFLTVEGVLVAGVVASQNFGVGKSQNIACILAIVGFMFAILWLFLVRSVQKGMDFLQDEVIKVKDPTYAEYLRRVRANTLVTGRQILNIYLPIGVMLVWAALMASHSVCIM